MRCSEARAGGQGGARASAWRSRSRRSPAASRRTSRATPTCSSTPRPGALAVRWDIALRDLDVALDLDADGDGKLTWGEVRAAWPRIEAYALPRLAHRRLPAARPASAASSAAATAPMRCCSCASTCTLAGAAGDPLRAVRRRRPDASRHRQGRAARRAGRRCRCSTRRAAGAGAAAAASAASAAERLGRSAPRRRRAGSSSREGMHHIVTGYDHVLFLLCLLLPAVMRRRRRALAAGRAAVAGGLAGAGIVTAFTVAHSITLALAALKLVSLPPAFIEPAIAVTIVLAALDNVWPIFPVRRVVVDLLLRPDPRLRLRRRARRAGPADRRVRLGAAPVQPRARGRAAGDRRRRDGGAVRAAPLAALSRGS